MSEQRTRAARRAARRGFDQHFLRSSRLAVELVRCAGLTRADLVLEIGAGRGRLTSELAQAAGRVLAVELDPRLAQELRVRLGRRPNVTVIQGDALALPLPAEPFRVVANLPFGQTTAFFHRLFDDPRLPLDRADLIVQWGAALKRARVWPSTLLGATWGAWWTFRVERRLAAPCFEPAPSVEAALLVVARREVPLVAPADARAYREFVRRGFREGLRAVSPTRQGASRGEESGPRATSTHTTGRRSFMRSGEPGRVPTDPSPLTRSSEAGKESNESLCPRPVHERADTLTEARLASGKVLLDAEAIGRTLSRIAHEIIEGNPDLEHVALVGIHTRGVPLAHRLRRLIVERAGHEVALGTVDITFYRDDVQVRGREAPLHPQPVVRATKLDFPLRGMTCVLVDDVLYTGRTIRAAIDALFDYGRPARVQLAVLADRGHRELPIRPDYVGKNLPTARDERIQVELVEVDEIDRIVLKSEAEERSLDS